MHAWYSKVSMMQCNYIDYFACLINVMWVTPLKQVSNRQSC